MGCLCSWKCHSWLADVHTQQNLFLVWICLIIRNDHKGLLMLIRTDMKLLRFNLNQKPCIIQPSEKATVWKVNKTHISYNCYDYSTVMKETCCGTGCEIWYVIASSPEVILFNNTNLRKTQQKHRGLHKSDTWCLVLDRILPSMLIFSSNYYCNR